MASKYAGGEFSLEPVASPEAIGTIQEGEPHEPQVYFSLLIWDKFGSAQNLDLLAFVIGGAGEIMIYTL